MGSPWTDKTAILRDLSVAQGRWVPGGIGSPVAGAKPPMHNIKEETEEEYYQRFASLEPGGVGDFSAGADLFRIKKMLKLVHEDTHNEDEMISEEMMTGPIEITKMHPIAVHFVPKNRNHAKENVNPIRKPRRERNVAIASIMALASQLTQEPLKLSKPEDFMKPTKENEDVKERRIDSVNKVTNWLQSQDITSMFKKKSSITEQSNSAKDAESLKSLVLSESPKSPNGDLTKSPSGSYLFQHKATSPKCIEKSVKSPNAKEKCVKSMNGYTPTAWAEEYYKKAVDRSLVRDLVRDDVWGRAEKVMKELDLQKEELRKKEAAEALEAEIARQCAALEAVKSADLEPVDLEPAGLEPVDMEPADLEPVDLETAGLEPVDLESVDLAPAADSSSSLFMDAEADGVAHIFLPRGRHALQPAAACQVCRVCRAVAQHYRKQAHT